MRAVSQWEGEWKASAVVKTLFPHLAEGAQLLGKSNAQNRSSFLS